MTASTKSLHDTDFVEWASQTAGLVRQGRLDELDLAAVAEEIEDLGKSERSAVRSQLRHMLAHLLKARIHPERAGASWRASVLASVLNAQTEIADRIVDSPSLRRLAETDLQRVYRQAVKLALLETGIAGKNLPEQCPYPIDDLIEGDLNSLWPR